MAKTIKPKPMTSMEIIDVLTEVGDSAFIQAMKIFRNVEAAQDESSRLIVEALSLIQKGTPPTNPAAWARKGVTNDFIDQLRHNTIAAEYRRTQIQELMDPSKQVQDDYKMVLWEVVVSQLSELTSIEKDILLGILKGQYKSIHDACTRHGVGSKRYRTDLRLKLRKALRDKGLFVEVGE